MKDKERVQDLFNYTIEQIEEAVAQEQIDKAYGQGSSWETGRKLAYADIARRLVTMGAKAKKGGDA